MAATTRGASRGTRRATAALGWRVLRLSEEEVFSDLDAVVARITAAAAQRQR